MKLASVIFSIFAFLFMAVAIVLIVCSLPVPGLICFACSLACIIGANRTDPQHRACRQRVYRKAQRHQRDGDAIPKCAHCRVIVFPDGHTERIPCHWHADIQSVALEREATR